jgi:hypothetical protein
LGSTYGDKLPASFPQNLLESAVPLKSMGLSDLAWKRNDAIQVVDALAECGYAILGGDVLVERAGRLTHTYDSWFVNREEAATWRQFVLESKNRAISYISRYSETNGDDYYYVLVFDRVGQADS